MKLNLQEYSKHIQLNNDLKRKLRKELGFVRSLKNRDRSFTVNEEIDTMILKVLSSRNIN